MMNSLMFYLLFALAIISESQPDDQVTSLIYRKCLHDGLVTEEYTFQRDDSTVLRQEFAEGRKTPRKLFGYTSKRDSSLYINTIVKQRKLQYFQDSVDVFNFLINQTEYEKWMTLKVKLLDSFVNDGEIKSFESYSSTDGSHERLLLILKYDISRQGICDSDIMIEVPIEILRRR